MADQPQKPNIFQKALALSSAMMDAQLAKARNGAPTSNFSFGKAVTQDRAYHIGSQGFTEKPGAIGYEFQRQMAIKSSVVSAIIRTQQNKAAAFAQIAAESSDKGFRVVLKDEKAAMDKIHQELFPEKESTSILDEEQSPNDIEENQTAEERSVSNSEEIKKAEGDESEEILDESIVQDEDMQMLDSMTPPQEAELSDKDKERAVKEELDNRTAKKRQALAEFVLNCGELKDRPFPTKRWNFNAFVRATVWDSLVYDQLAVELVPKEAAELKGRMNLHHFQPIDGATIRYASPELKKYKDHDLNSNQDILYPEEELKALEESDALDLDEDRLENDEYKYVQVIKGRIQRAFTEDELGLGIRNPITDIYSNGYGLSELEILTSLVSSHLHTEYYNRAYFINGFSAKGILHIKANLNRAKLEDLRRHWNHMVKGNRNSFQTPIMSGMEEIQWIPLTQSHSEMEFSLWMNYLIKMICAIYQIDPSEIGYGMKEEGGGGSSMSGDNTSEKLAQSKDKGFIPLMTFLGEFVNKNIMDKLDPDYRLEWVGLIEDSPTEVMERQASEVKFKKSVNEIREEDGLPPIPGADHLILDPVYFQWFAQFSEEGKEMSAQMQLDEQNAFDQQNPEEEPEADNRAEDWNADEASKENDHQRSLEMESHKADIAPKPEKVAKSISIEVYKLDDK